MTFLLNGRAFKAIQIRIRYLATMRQLMVIRPTGKQRLQEQEDEGDPKRHQSIHRDTDPAHARSKRFSPPRRNSSCGDQAWRT